MKLKIAGYTIDKYNEVSVSLHYNSVASSFRFKVQFDPNNSVHKKLFKPYSYHSCQLYYQNILLITGICLVGHYEDGAVESLVNISGYSKTGVLEDCVVVANPAQSVNLTLKQIAEKVCAHYKISVKIDPEVADVCNQVIPDSTPDIDEKIKGYLDKLCSQRNVILSHTTTGELLFTKSKAGKLLTNESTMVRVSPTSLTSELEGAPDFNASGNVQKSVNRPVLYKFQTGDSIWTRMVLNTNGQRMHSDIVVFGQASGGNAAQSQTLINPYVPVILPTNSSAIKRIDTTAIDSSLAGAPSGNAVIAPDSSGLPVRGQRPINKIQSSGDTITTDKAARNFLADELKTLTLTIDIASWVLGGNLITPNQMITAINPNCYLYKETKFFIQDVELRGDERSETATITCVVPEAYNDEVVKNIFA